MTNNQRRRLMSLSCPECESFNIQKRGYNKARTKQRLECQDCGSWSSVDFLDGKVSFFSSPIAPKIILFDIETHVKKAWLFRHGDQYVQPSSFERTENTMICWSAKYLGSDEVLGDCQTSREAKNKDHSRITKSLWKILSDADITISHNGVSFDLPMINTFFVRERLGLPNKFRNIDTCMIARKTFRFESNKLDLLCKELGLKSGKMETTIDLWKECFDGEQKSLDYMYEYNQMDSKILEDLYNVFLPYIPKFPNMGVWGDVSEPVCPYCHGVNFKHKGYFYTPNGKFESFRCECQAIFRSKENLLFKDARKNQMITG
jgi:transposase-like protein